MNISSSSRRIAYIPLQDFEMGEMKPANAEHIQDPSGESPAGFNVPENTGDPVYAAKATVLNDAIQEIGMGKYQWQLFLVVGFGWASDNLWPIITGLILTPIANEFRPGKPEFLTLSQNIGLLFGAVFWGFGCDIFGRKLAFNLTLLITGVFGLLAASSPSFAAIGCFAALWSVGVGGNLPVDSAIFLEYDSTHYDWAKLT